tara:strand:- start:374 stop:697 length:324 start_codon:yes stop_codon:yes gene_type:complete
MVRGALRVALSQKIKDGVLMVVDGPSVLTLDEPRTKLGAERLEELGVTGRTVLIDDASDRNLELAVRNLQGVRVIETSQLTARDVVSADTVVVSKVAIEHLGKVVSS